MMGKPKTGYEQALELAGQLAKDALRNWGPHRVDVAAGSVVVHLDDDAGNALATIVVQIRARAGVGESLVRVSLPSAGRPPEWAIAAVAATAVKASRVAASIETYLASVEIVEAPC